MSKKLSFDAWCKFVDREVGKVGRRNGIVCAHSKPRRSPLPAPQESDSFDDSSETDEMAELNARYRRAMAHVPRVNVRDVRNRMALLRNRRRLEQLCR